MKMTFLSAAFLLIVMGCSHVRQTERNENREAEHEWRSFNQDLSSNRYSTLEEINDLNVSELKKRCSFDLGEKAIFESGPIVAKGILYVTTFENTYAIKADSCELIWKQGGGLNLESSEPGTNRGVAYASGKVFRGTPDGSLIALDALTGKLIWKTAAADTEADESITAAPVVWRGMVFIGNSGGKLEGVRGRLMAFDANTGRSLWSTFLVPYENYEDALGGAKTWSSYTIDEGEGLLLAGTGNGTPPLGPLKPFGKDLFTNSIIALDAKKGKIHFSYQVTRHDFHGWAASTAPVLIKKSAAGRKIILEAGKDGLLHAVDLETRTEIYATPLTRRLNVTKAYSNEPVRFCPGIMGGSIWNGPSYHPRLNLVYVNSSDVCSTVRLDARNGNNPIVHSDLKKKWMGWVTAVNADTGKISWRHSMKGPMIAGVTSTASGLVFTGDLEGHLYAFDGLSGKLLLKMSIGSPIGGGVISYAVNAKQFIAIAAGTESKVWRSRSPTTQLIVFSL
ncbi:MAG: PQQ-binding-like beta-propeller repeat protein [Cryobacterium sp.]|nr:PQQ-binding-like beta-propeller repeat protein [Oligoflexia bacterium]